MKVRVRPRDGAGNPIPGAGSWEITAIKYNHRPSGDTMYLDEESNVAFPASWVTEHPEIKPEEGDICEFWDDAREHTALGVYGKISEIGYFPCTWGGTCVYYKNCRVLARKPRKREEIGGKLAPWALEYFSSNGSLAKDALYADLLRLILGGVEYGEVE